jgi:Transcriptional regulators
MEKKNGLIGYYAHRLSNAVDRRVDRAVASFNVTGKQTRVLGFIKRKSKSGNVYQKDIEEMFGVRRSSVTSMVQNLEKCGFITREEDKIDNRMKKLFLTEQGEIVFAHVTKEVEKTEKLMRNALTDEEFVNFVSAADKILETLSEK